MNDLDPAARLRLLERLMGHDPTEEECREMWCDRPWLERLLVLQELNAMEIDLPEADHTYLQAHDFELWRAKCRSELGSLTAVLDGLCVCREHNLLLPKWLHDILPRYLASIFLPDSDERFQAARARFKVERTKLKMMKRAQIVHCIYTRSRFEKERARNYETDSASPKGFESFGSTFRDWQYPPEIRTASEAGKIDQSIRVSSIVDASEIAHKVLQGTWAQAAEETIRQDYNKARVQLSTDLNRNSLSEREAE